MMPAGRRGVDQQKQRKSENEDGKQLSHFGAVSAAIT
jgi:hypothetical protein